MPVVPQSESADLEEALLATDDPAEHVLQRQETSKGETKIKIAMWTSLAANVLLLAAKAFGFFSCGSMAVLASLADSAVDLASQLVLWAASVMVRIRSSRYPVGRTRLETLGVIVCACIMAVAAYEVVIASGGQLYHGFVHHIKPHLAMPPMLYGILSGAVLLKLPLFWYCRRLKDVSPSMVALAEDHLNDVMSNFVALLTAAVTSLYPSRLWWLDPVGGLLISLYIVWSWLVIAAGEVDKILGKGADQSSIDRIRDIAESHAEELDVDCIRAYYFGSNQLAVEIEVVLPALMSVRESHDIALALQLKLEAEDDVERAHVHVDYQKREHLEHLADRALCMSGGD